MRDSLLWLASPGIFPWVALAFGLCVGSFLNVVIHRLPRMMDAEWRAQCAELRGEEPVPAPAFNLAKPRSRCPACGHGITALENIPVLSFLWLRARCSACGAPISWRYPAVELFAGVLGWYCASKFGMTLAGFAAMGFAWAMLAASMIDFDTQLLPDAITLPLLWAGLLVNLWGTFAPLPHAVVGAMAGYLTLWSVYWLFKLATGKEGMGFGDFKLLAAIGAWTGWSMLPIVILGSSMVGAIVGLSLMVLARHGRNVPIPFGPYLAAAGMISLLWGPELLGVYVRWFAP